MNPQARSRAETALPKTFDTMLMFAIAATSLAMGWIALRDPGSSLNAYFVPATFVAACGLLAFLVKSRGDFLTYARGKRAPMFFLGFFCFVAANVPIYDHSQDVMLRTRELVALRAQAVILKANVDYFGHQVSNPSAQLRCTQKRVDDFQRDVETAWQQIGEAHPWEIFTSVPAAPEAPEMVRGYASDCVGAAAK
jgi:hypothetical protein